VLLAVAAGEQSFTGERPQQLDDLLLVPPRFAGPGPVAEPVEGVADFHMRLALPPRFDGKQARRVLVTVIGE